MAAEKNFENKIKSYIKEIKGWEIKYWSGKSITGQKFTRDGVPDILACIQGKFIAIETKAQNGKPSALQIDTIEELRAAGAIAVVAYPSAWKLLVEILNNPFADWSDLPIEIK